MTIGRQLVGVLARRPWIVISTMAHVVALAVISVVVWQQQAEQAPLAITTVAVAAPAPEVQKELEVPEVIDRKERPLIEDESIEPNPMDRWIDLRDPSLDDVAADSSGSPALGDTPAGSAIGLAGPGHHGWRPSPFGGTTPGGKFVNRGPGGPP